MISSVSVLLMLALRTLRRERICDGAEERRQMIVARYLRETRARGGRKSQGLRLVSIKFSVGLLRLLSDSRPLFLTS